MRAVFDTNIVVSALVFGRRLAWLRNAWSSGIAVPVVCRETTSELVRVLTYPKFRLTATERQELLGDFLPWAHVVAIPDHIPELPVACRDRDDALFLRLAMAACAPLVSGDADLAVLRGVAPVAVLSATEFRQSLTRISPNIAP